MKILNGTMGLLLVGLTACSGADDNLTYLENSVGKADAVELAISLGTTSPSAALGLVCDGPAGCAGVIEIAVSAPEACTLLGDCGMLPIGRVDVATAIITQGSRTTELPIGVESIDGVTIQSSSLIEFEAAGDELVQISITHAMGQPDVTLAVFAEWTANMSPGIDGGIDTGGFGGCDGGMCWDTSWDLPDTGVDTGRFYDAGPPYDGGPGVDGGRFWDAGPPYDGGPGVDAGRFDDAGPSYDGGPGVDAG